MKNVKIGREQCGECCLVANTRENTLVIGFGVYQNDFNNKGKQRAFSYLIEPRYQNPRMSFPCIDSPPREPFYYVSKPGSSVSGASLSFCTDPIRSCCSPARPILNRILLASIKSPFHHFNFFGTVS
mmetsp:Transcript_45205/g.54420  ORF Transcript_45205/g.54420 Transcript_45205/m.54420 type:complete len:127 (-) Transcript_45205:149-529(-)